MCNIGDFLMCKKSLDDLFISNNKYKIIDSSLFTTCLKTEFGSSKVLLNKPLKNISIQTLKEFFYTKSEERLKKLNKII